MNEFSLASARAAAAADNTAIWVGEFLASRGSDNEILAAALAQKPHWWVGPILVPLEDLVRLAGPEDDALVPIETEQWEGDVEEMQESIGQGWEPPPLLAEYQDGRLLLQDGNHRYEALVRAEETATWVLVFFDQEGEYEAFIARSGA
ncbi:MAG: hypothetical protein QOF59_250, partial [Actinomycetota bacterium]|jgi:hypothetical protein|nr:hypothetical protein [Actinomycetota bacterium]